MQFIIISMQQEQGTLDHKAQLKVALQIKMLALSPLLKILKAILLEVATLTTKAMDSYSMQVVLTISKLVTIKALCQNLIETHLI